MMRIYGAISIGRPPDRVFAYVTTPGNWPAWHPSSLHVSGATDHSLAIGEQVTEDYLVAGWRGRVTWVVRARESPRRWVIENVVEREGRSTITYTLTPEASGTRFEREFTYKTRNVLVRLLGQLVIRRRITAESAEALRRLKQVLESD